MPAKITKVNIMVNLFSTGVFCVKGTNSWFKSCATAVPNLIDRIKFDIITLPCYAAVLRLSFKRCATAIPNSIRKS